MLTRMARGLTAAGVTVAGLTAAGTFAAPVLASPAHPAQNYPTYAVKQVLSGAKLSHVNTKTGKKEALSEPEDVTTYGGNVYAAFQNGVGPKGQASASGNQDSTVVEFGRGGSVLAQWDIRGGSAGLTANPATGDIVATVNQDANSSLFVIDQGGQVTHYAYNEALPHKGGTGSVSFFNGKMLVSASAPGTTGETAPRAGYPAVYSVTLDQTSKVATVKPYYYDESAAKIANNPGGLGTNVHLALTDPGANLVVPSGVPRWSGDFVLTSQAEKEQVISSQPGSLWALKLSQPVGDMVFPTSTRGVLYATDSAADTVDSVNETVFWKDSAFVAVNPCAAADAGSGCSTPAYLGLLNLVNGQVSAVTLTGTANLSGGKLEPGRLAFLSTGDTQAPPPGW